MQFEPVQMLRPIGTRAHSFWDDLPRPIIGLAPMDGVGDQPFRHIQKKYGDPALVYTEFTSVDEICVARAANRLRTFLYDETQRPIIAQIFGAVPHHFYQVSILLCELGFDGIDINMGCPSRSVAQGGAGAALIRTPELAQEIVRATARGIADWQNGARLEDSRLGAAVIAEAANQRAGHCARNDRSRPIPVSVKTRIGYDEPVIERWMAALTAVAPAAIVVHGRTLKQRYSGYADWESISRAAEFVRPHGILFLGNGDVTARRDARQRAQSWGLDGVLIGRASLGNPFVFQEAAPDAGRYLAVAAEHAHLYEETYRRFARYHFPPMRKHLSAYARHAGLVDEDRRRLLRAESAAEAIALLQEAMYTPAVA